MPRVRKGAARTQARKRILRAARGYFGSSHKSKYKADYALIRAAVYQFRDRRRLKRDMRRLWITRLTAACRMRGARYSQFINGLKLSGINLNRKMLSQIAIEDPKAFDQIMSMAMKSTRVHHAAGRGSKAAVLTGVKTGEALAKGQPRAATAQKTAVPGPANYSSGGSSGDIEDIEGIGPVYGDKLRAIGISTVAGYLKAATTKKGRAEIATKTGISDAHILTWANMADLFRIKGVAGEFAELLEASGVDTVKELGHRVPANLTQKMEEVNAEKRLTRRTPSEKEVTSWVEQAKILPPSLEY